MHKYVWCCLIMMLGACAQKEGIKQITWTGCSHMIGDTLLSLYHDDTLYHDKQFYMAHHVWLDENGDGMLITREDYDAPRKFYQIKLADSITKLVFSLAQDSAVFNFKQPQSNPEKGTIYCGYNYLITLLGNNNEEQYFTYLPPDANPKLKLLHAVFENIEQQPHIIQQTNIDTLLLDSVILEKVKYFHPLPIRSRIKFTPPEIVPNNNE